MKNVRIAISLLLMLIMTGCGLFKEAKFSDFDGTSYSQLGPQIVLAKLTDAYGTERTVRALGEINSGPIRLSRSVNNGRYLLDVELRNTNSYVLEYLVGSNGNIANAEVYFSISCTDDQSCQPRIVEHCYFSPRLIMYCRAGNIFDPSFLSAQLTDPASSLPAPATVFIRACNLRRTACDIKSIEVTLE